MKIAVGTTNPNKIKAVFEVINTIWPNSEIIPINVSSQISDQPNSDEETIQGATNRAKNALKETNADMGIGIEGGLKKINGETFVTNWAVIIDKENKIGIGCGPKFMLPKIIIKKIDEGKELGDAMNEFTGQKSIKHSDGAIGVFTNNLLTRKDNNKTAIICALTKIINPKLYDN